MKTTASLLVLTAGLAVSAASFSQEVAGRLIVSVGDVAIQRGGERIPAQFGTQLRAGDTLQLGERSNAQVLMTDQSVVALRPDTNFKIEEYAFAGKPAEEQRSLFSLLKGGMRTVTGLIGRVNHKNYAVNTPTATVGIRGTNYTLVQCEGNCRNANGTLAPNGTYGAVTDGRIGVTNQSGEHQFGADQYFHVASSTAAPTQLIAPPGFIRDTLEGRARVKERGEQQQAQARSQGQGQGQGQQQQTSSSSGSSESASTVAATDDSRVSSSVTTYTPPVVLNPIVTVPTTTTSTTTNLIAPALSTIFFHLDSLSGPLNFPATCSPQPCTSSTVVGGTLTLGVNLVLQRAYAKVDFLLANGSQFNTGTPFSSGGIPITVSGGQITFSGTFNAADFPQGLGGFRCSTCGPGDTLGFLTSISVSGVVNGSQASLTFSGTSANGGGSFSANLTQQTPPNNLAAVAIIPNLAGGSSATSDAYWGVGVNSAGALTQIGVRGSGGVDIASVGSATIVTPSNATFTLPDGSKIIGGAWIGSGANVTDFNYANFTTGSSTVIPWIVGSLTNTLPAGLGTSVTYTPVISAVNLTASGTQLGVLNSGSLTADFVNRNVSISLNATNNSAGNTFQMNGSSGVSATSARFGSGFSHVTCSGPCNGGATPNGNFAGFFAGSNAEGAGVAFSAGFGTNGVTGVVGLKR
jgi:hypothetical protein